MGIIHVLTGPASLSSLAALSVGSSCRAFQLGLRWGIGHSGGLVFLCLLFLYLKGQIDLLEISDFFNVIVGVLMVAFGSYGIYYTINSAIEDECWQEIHRNSKDRDYDLRYRDTERLTADEKMLSFMDDDEDNDMLLFERLERR